MKCLSGFLIDEQDEMVELHSLNQFVDVKRFVVGLVTIEEHGKVGVRIASADRRAVSVDDPTSDLVGFDDDAQGHEEEAPGSGFSVHN
jgi:hypothetical protein